MKEGKNSLTAADWVGGEWSGGKQEKWRTVMTEWEEEGGVRILRELEDWGFITIDGEKEYKQEVQNVYHLQPSWKYVTASAVALRNKDRACM